MEIISWLLTAYRISLDTKFIDAALQLGNEACGPRVLAPPSTRLTEAPTTAVRLL
jgi:hypothetical protein